MRTMHLFAGIGGGLLADLIFGHTPIKYRSKPQSHGDCSEVSR